MVTRVQHVSCLLVCLSVVGFGLVYLISVHLYLKQIIMSTTVSSVHACFAYLSACSTKGQLVALLLAKLKNPS